MSAYVIRDDEGELLRLVREVAKGEPLVLVSNGEPIAEVVPIKIPGDPAASRIGFMRGKIEVPANFDRIFADEITELFEGGD